MKNFIRCAALCLVLLPSAGAAQDFEIGFAAYNAGDYQVAINELLPLAKLGNPEAQFIVGEMYDGAKGVLEDDAEAVKWYHLASGQGHADAQNNLGVKYLDGDGVLQDYVTAYMWLNISAANGGLFARLSRMSALEVMVPSDISEGQKRTKVCTSSGYRNCD